MAVRPGDENENWKSFLNRWHITNRSVPKIRDPIILETMMTEKPTQTFHIHPRILISRMTLIAGVMAVVPVIALISRDESMQKGLPILLVIEGLTLLLVFWLMFSYIYVAVSPEGIRYRSLGYQIASKWEDIAAIDMRWMGSEGQVEGLTLRKEGTHVNPVLRAGSFISPESRIALGQARDFIPLSILFTQEWRDTEIGAAIRRYAPHVFKNQN